MARSRNIKPGFFTDAEVVECDVWVRLLFAGLWTIADREGRLIDRPKQIKIHLFPADDVSVDEGLQQLADHGLIIRYQVDGKRYVQVTNFIKHQNPHYKEELSQIPPPPGYTNAVVANGPSEELRRKILARDGRCLQCGAIDDLTLDHITPRALGGTDERENLQTLCRRCNSAKNNRQAASLVNASSANDRPTLADDPPVNPADSPLLIPDSPIPDSGLLGEAGADAPRKPKRAHAIPDNWSICAAMRVWALGEGFDDVTVSRETVKFINHFRANGKPMKDWDAAWRNWMLRSREFASARASPRPNSGSDIDYLAKVARGEA